MSATSQVTAKANGTARITVTSRDGNFTANCDVAVGVTGIIDISNSDQIKVFSSRTGTSAVRLNVVGLESNSPVSIRLTDLLGRVFVERKNIVPVDGKIQIDAKLPENINLAVVQLQYPSGATQTVKVSLKL